MAWMYRKRAVPHGRPATDWLFTRDETEAEILARYPHNEVMRLYAAPAPREVSEAMVAAIRLMREYIRSTEYFPNVTRKEAMERCLAALSAETGTR